MRYASSYSSETDYSYREGDKSYSANITTLDKDTALSLVEQNHKVATDLVDKTLDISREMTADRSIAQDDSLEIMRKSLDDKAQREADILAEEREALLRKVAIEGDISMAEARRFTAEKAEQMGKQYEDMMEGGIKRNLELYSEMAHEQIENLRNTEEMRINLAVEKVALESDMAKKQREAETDLARKHTAFEKLKQTEMFDIEKMRWQAEFEIEKSRQLAELEKIRAEVSTERNRLIADAEVERDKVKTETEKYRMSKAQSWFYRIFYPLVGAGLGVATYLMLNPQIWG